MTSTWYSSRRIAETYSGYKVLVEEGTDRILGAHILGSEAAAIRDSEWQIFRMGLFLKDISTVRPCGAEHFRSRLVAVELHANELDATILRTTFVCGVARDRSRLAIAFGAQAATVDAVLGQPAHDCIGSIA